MVTWPDIKCRTCKKPYATVLHFESKPNPNAEKVKEADHVTHNCVKVCHVSDNCQDIPMSSLFIPVWICHKDIPSKKVMTYAVLDDQSDTWFITDGVCKELGINGPETVIELGTMHTVQNIKTQKISGLFHQKTNRLIFLFPSRFQESRSQHDEIKFLPPTWQEIGTT